MLSEYRKKAQQLEIEIQTLREKNENTARQVRENQNQHASTIGDFQRQVDDEQRRLEGIKGQLSDQLCQYRELMSVKVALDREISTYKQLLEGEEIRISNKL